MDQERSFPCLSCDRERHPCYRFSRAVSSALACSLQNRAIENSHVCVSMDPDGFPASRPSLSRFSTGMKCRPHDALKLHAHFAVSRATLDRLAQFRLHIQRNLMTLSYSLSLQFQSRFDAKEQRESAKLACCPLLDILMVIDR